MSKKDEILRKVKELEEEERLRAQLAKSDEPVSIKPVGMPIGCWLWIIFFGALAFGIFKKYFN